MVLLQLLIAATGNYGFFNLLSVVLCLTMLDDRDWESADGDIVHRSANPARDVERRRSIQASWARRQWSIAAASGRGHGRG